MRIGIDIRCLQNGGYGGVKTYSFELVSRLIELSSDDEFVLFTNSLRKSVQRIGYSVQGNGQTRLVHTRYPNKFFNLSLRLFRRPKIDEVVGGVDVFLALNPMRLPLRRAKKAVIFHDLSFLHNPHWYTRRQRYYHWLMNMRREACEASAIIAVSQATKKDLMEFFAVPEKKITVVYPATDRTKFYPDISRGELAKARQRYDLPDQFILYLGTIEPRKNVLEVIRAYEMFRAALSATNPFAPKLVIAGTWGWKYQDVERVISCSSVRQDIRYVGTIRDEHKAALYKLSMMLVWPSFYEGFGLPVLEALHLGVPVITSASSSIPEITKDAVLLANPFQPELLARAMEILLDKNAREEFTRRGLMRASSFQWDAAVQKVLTVLHSLSIGK